jgi:O-antigen/teichoic acid export membrane protein
VLLGSFNQAVFLSLSFATKTVFISQLGIVYLGINGLFTNLFVLFSSIEFGIGIAMMYSLYKPLAENNKEKIGALYNFYRSIYRNTSIGIGITGMALFPFLKLLINTEVPVAHKELYYLLFLINAVVYNQFIYKSYLIIADQKKYLVSLYYMLFEGSVFILQIITLLEFQSYSIYLALVIFKTVFYCGFLHFKIQRVYPYVIDKKGEFSKKDKITLHKSAFNMIVYKVSEMMICGTDNIIISVILGTIYVGYYSNYEFILQGISSVVALIFASLAASVGNLFVDNDLNKKYQIFHLVQNLNLWVAGFMTTGIYLLSQSFITAWIGPSYLLSNQVLLIISLNFYLTVMRDANKMFRESAGLFDKMKRVIVLNAVLNILFSVLLGLKFGMVGVFSATVISGLLTSYPFEAYLIHRDYLRKSMKTYLIMQAKGAVLVVMSVMITGFFMGLDIGTGWGSFFFKVIIFGVISNAFYFIMLKQTDGVQFLICTGKQLILNQLSK